MHDLEAGCDQPFEIGIGPLLVMRGIAGDHDRLPAELGQVARPQARAMATDEIAGREMAADEGDPPAHAPALPATRRA